jgi:hypothetical protein
MKFTMFTHRGAEPGAGPGLPIAGRTVAARAVFIAPAMVSRRVKRRLTSTPDMYLNGFPFEKHSNT